jgi:predicted DNA-binding transcriptional regulator AlpA
MFDDLIELSAAAEKLRENNFLSKSTLYKIASGNYVGELFADFPRPRRIGGKWFWKWSDIDAWIGQQWDAAPTSKPKTEKEKESSPVPVGFGRGRPSRIEENAAAAAGLTVKDWRKSAQAGVCHA